jgi:hypothetical protein
MNVRCLFNPGVGLAYFIQNIKTGEQIKASTLTIRDVEQKPHRSPKGTPASGEFFKMKSGTKKSGFTYYIFKNSIQFPQCISDDGVWLFTGKKANGDILPRIADVLKKNNKEEESSSSGNSEVRYKIEQLDDISMSDEKIEEAMNITNEDDFSSDSLLSILGKDNI